MTAKSSIYTEVLRLFGALDNHKLVQIAELDPSLDELEITAAYLAGMDDVMGEERLPLAGKAASVYDIVTRDEVPGEEDYRQG